MARKKTRRVKLYVVKEGGYSMTGFGWRPRGGYFDLDTDLAGTLSVASPQIFSFSEPSESVPDKLQNEEVRR